MSNSGALRAAECGCIVARETANRVQGSYMEKP